ncbi:MAG: CvpA family protein [Lachnospiraceae bacterium]|nr:CvpA family protein [Lachnospiraceae bacterium]
MIVLGVIAVFLILMGIIGWKKGIFGFVSGLIAVILAVLVTWGLKPFVKDWVEKKTDWDEKLTESISEKMLSGIDSELEMTTFVSCLPAPSEQKAELRADLIAAQSLEERKSIVSERVTDWSLSVLVSLGVFLVALGVVLLLFIPIRKALKLPGLRTINGFLGMLFGLVIAVFVVMGILLLVPLFSGTGVGDFFSKQIEESKVLGWIYDHNLIMRLFEIFKAKI